MIEIVSDGYRYRESKGFVGSLTVHQIAHMDTMTQVLLDANETWATRLTNEPERLKFADSYYLDSLVLAIDGEPYGVIRILDDIVQFVPVHQVGRIEEDK